jgi:zinc/manganese transport system substrate-binding protein
MPKRIMLAAILAATSIGAPAEAALKVFATSPDWGALTTELGGDKVSVYVATTAFQDIHRVDAKPSLIARTRSADLVVASGAELEIGWLPLLIQESGNNKIQPGNPGYFEAAKQVSLLEVPAQVDRSMGDVHADGNPHLQLDPHNIAAVGRAVSQRLASLDTANAAYYAARSTDFQSRWQQAIARWESQATRLKGAGVVVVHKDQAYLIHWLGLRELAAIEPKPGVPPSAAYLASLISRLAADRPRAILRNAYNDPRAADWLSQRVQAPVVVLPFSVGGTPGANSLFGLFDDTVARLLAAVK